MLYTIHGRLSQSDRYEYIIYSLCIHIVYMNMMLIAWQSTRSPSTPWCYITYSHPLHPPKNNLMQILNIEKKMRWKFYDVQLKILVNLNFDFSYFELWWKMCEKEKEERERDGKYKIPRVWKYIYKYWN